MRRTRIKVCGLCSSQDARLAVAAGVDALGVIFVLSRREVAIPEAGEILEGVPPYVARVGVFMDQDATFIEEAIARCGLTDVQFHGSESPEFCSSISVPVTKTIKVGTDFSWNDAEPYRGHVAALLLDKLSSKGSGGTGETFAWQSITTPPDWAPFVVAGGLTPVNVSTPIRLLRPYAVDVSSGVEERLRHKDRMRLLAFVAAVRAADEEATR
jgi:phosphoribosylanthranilate isomerase